MPNPFRHYEGVPLLDLPADPPGPEIPALEVLAGKRGETHLSKDGASFLSQLLFYSASISASKRVPTNGSTYALRVNPSSGNLHPTEFHFCTRGLIGWPDGLYHYRPSSHMAEQRAYGDFANKLAGTAAPLVFLLTSIAWREAWKYRDRAYRYCMHDIGHAWQSLALAACAMGCESSTFGQFNDDDASKTCLLSEDEWPMLIVTLGGAAVPLEPHTRVDEKIFGGAPNQLSEERITYSRIEQIHAATKLHTSAVAAIPRRSNAGSHCKLPLPAPAVSKSAFGQVVRQRRSALDFRGGEESISLAELSAWLIGTGKPLYADFEIRRFVQLYLYAHRVDGLSPGVYLYWPTEGTLEQVKGGDQRVAAAALSLGQQLAGNACVAFSLIGDFEHATRIFGERGYRYVHFEAGAIGQRLYLAAEAFGLRATGIGAFYDDEVHRYLNIEPEQGQVVYHFAVGHPVPDLRLEA
jgi:SagB-type dehydrogenase family enzyme